MAGIKLTGKIIPKNDAFTGLVDAKHVIGGTGNVLPIATMPLFESSNSSVAITKGPTSINFTIDNNVVVDENYVHTDNNFTDEYLGLLESALQEESDPVYLADKPSIALKTEIPTTLSQLGDDSTHRLVTDTEKLIWSGKQDALSFVEETSNKFLRDDNVFVSIEPPAGGYANNLYLTTQDSDVSGYKVLSYTPDSTETEIAITVNSSEGNKVVETLLYPTGVDVTNFPSGLWSFSFYGRVSSSNGITKIGVQYFRRLLNGTEVNLFTVWSDELNNTIDEHFSILTTQPAYSVNATDRMGLRILVQTSATSDRTIYYKKGDGYAAYLNNPNKLPHNNLRRLNFDLAYQHVDTLSEQNTLSIGDKIVVANSSGKVQKLNGLSTQFLKADGSLDSSEFSLSSHNHTLASLSEKSYNSLDDLPSIPVIDSNTVIDANYVHTDNNLTDALVSTINSALQEELDPTVPLWAKEPLKPTYTYAEVGAEAANSNIQEHIGSTGPHVTLDDKTKWNSPNTLYTPSGLTALAYTDNGMNLHIDGNIYQNGNIYETHAEQVYTKKDTIILREGATGGLGSGELSGLTIKNYDGLNDGSIKIDKDGWMRIGDSGNEQKIATIEETSTNDWLMKYSTSANRLESIDPLTLPISTLATRKFVDQNGGTIYHITRWFTPTSALTIAANGLSATITSGQFTSAMTGAKLKLTGGVNEPIITYVSTNQITLSFAVDASFFGKSVGVSDWGCIMQE